MVASSGELRGVLSAIKKELQKGSLLHVATLRMLSQVSLWLAMVTTFQKAPAA